MTSKPAECFVHITLPGETRAVPCGHFALVGGQRSPVGRFVYSKSYLDRVDAVAIDPVRLRLAPRMYETRSFHGVFRALLDACPDAWGRRVLERHTGRRLGEMDVLLLSPDDRAGALGFGLEPEPPPPSSRFNQVAQLERLQAIADAVVADAPLPAGADLMSVGTAMGGARPKAVVEDDQGLWLAKFNHRDDRFDCARVERAMLELARSCGIRVADSKVVQVAGRSVLLVRRFDRAWTPQGWHRLRLVSALTVLGAGDGLPSRERWSYVLLAEKLRRISAEPEMDAAELFRRMCFNALVSNSDDHPRNHALIARDRKWRLSPAYDVVPSIRASGDHRELSMVCGDWGPLANATNLLSQASRFELERAEAVAIIDDMLERIRTTWRARAQEEGVTEQDCARIAGAFAHRGFMLAPP
jgi:serine/threonine-protein kinase HipA